MCKTYYAKSRLPSGHQPTLKEHLGEVSELAAAFGSELDMANAARLAGLLHDFGKYSERFRGVLERTAQAIDHALPGAAMLLKSSKREALPRHNPEVRPRYRPVAEAVNGHHSGLVHIGELNEYLVQSRANTQPVICNGGRSAALAGDLEYNEAVTHFSEDFPEFSFEGDYKPPREHAADNIESMLFTRMLFSCLVDADYSVSARDEEPDYLSRTERTDFDAQQLLSRLLEIREEIRIGSKADPALNRLRDEVFDRCGEMAALDAALFTLTAPTGIGKTLALLYFALLHCLHTGKKRIIVVLPFLTLAEQNTKIYSEIIPYILQDHSQRDLADTERDFASRWSTPVIVTTSVKFFEALFAQKPTDCRKLHHIANSVVLFDEAQSLPPEVTTATLQAVNALCRRYRCTMVFSTATQPDFSAIEQLDWAPTEILPMHSELYAKLKRTSVDWRITSKTPFEEIAESMKEQKSVCAIVNLRKHANLLFGLLRERCAPGEVFYLTTFLCPAHRSDIIKHIHERLKDKLPCRVVATQCIEAGVDLDFDALYRALAPLDAIIQAAGRCNRNGRIARGGKVTVFVPDEKDLYPGIWYKNAAELVKRLWMAGGKFSDEQDPEQTQNINSLDIHDPEQIRQYYRALFKNAHDHENLTNAIEERSFEKVAQAYKLIESHGVQVIVPYAPMAALFEEIYDDAVRKGITPTLMRKAAPLTVTSYLGQEELLGVAERLQYPPRRAQERKDSGYYILRPNQWACYTEDMGLQISIVKSDEVAFPAYY